MTKQARPTVPLTPPQQALAGKHLGLCRHLINDRRVRWAVGVLGADEALSQGHLAVCRAAARYVDDGRPASTYFGAAIINGLIGAARKELKYANTYPLGRDWPDLRPEAAPDYEAELAQEKNSLWAACAQLRARDRQILQMRFQDNYTLEQVGERLHLTRERVRQLQKHALARLRERLDPDRFGL